MKFDESSIYHYLYGYKPMRLATVDEVTHNVPQNTVENTNIEDPETNGKTDEGKQLNRVRLPDGIALCVSSLPGAQFGACAIQNIPAGTWFGPFEGKLVRINESFHGHMSECMWEIFHDSKVSHFLDGRSQNTWMSFVKCARHKKEQNMVVFQYHGCIYYRTTREIGSGSELLVWYDTKYTQLLGLPLAWNENKATHGKRKVIGRCSGDNLKKKKIQPQKIFDATSFHSHIDQELQQNTKLPLQKQGCQMNHQHFNGSNYFHVNTNSLEPERSNPIEQRTHMVCPSKYNKFDCIKCHQSFQNNSLLDSHRCSASPIMIRKHTSSHVYPQMHIPLSEHGPYMPQPLMDQMEFVANPQRDMHQLCPTYYNNHSRSGHFPTCTMSSAYHHHPEHSQQHLVFHENQDNCTISERNSLKFRPT